MSVSWNVTASSDPVSRSAATTWSANASVDSPVPMSRTVAYRGSSRAALSSVTRWMVSPSRNIVSTWSYLICNPVRMASTTWRSTRDVISTPSRS